MIVRREQKKVMQKRVSRASNVELWTSDVAPVRHLSFCELQRPSLDAHRNDEVMEVIASSSLLEGYIHLIIMD
jgi:hypothetical protein